MEKKEKGGKERKGKKAGRERKGRQGGKGGRGKRSVRKYRGRDLQKECMVSAGAALSLNILNITELSCV